MQQELTLTIRIDEDETNTLAFAELDIRADHFEAVGRARRNQEDRPMSIIGEELATGRALAELARQVMDSARTKIDQFLT